MLDTCKHNFDVPFGDSPLDWLVRMPNQSSNLKLKLILFQFQNNILCGGLYSPVTENVLPAEPIVIVRSHISGNVQIRICSLSS